MYIIPKDKVIKIESHVKPEYLKNINELVKQGIASAVKDVRSKITFGDPRLLQWCNDLGRDLMDPGKEIYYKKITEASPELLVKIYEKFKTDYNCTFTAANGKKYTLFDEQGWNKAKKVTDLEKAKKFLTRCFPYGRFASKEEKQYDAYRYCKAMDINVCVYCNAQLTHTVTRESGKAIRPQIDHFLPKSRFPMFALSFYNIIPACQSCNFLKGDTICDLSEIYHPYEKVCADFRFIWHVKNLYVAYGSMKARQTGQVLHTEDVYNIYEGVAKKIAEKVEDYDPVYIEEIMELMNKYRSKSEKLDKEAVIRRLYDYVPKEECFDTPLGELRHDILADRLDKAYRS